MCVVIKSRPEFKVGHVGSKTRSLGQFLEKPCVLSRRHSFDPVFMKLCQNDFLTLNKRLSRRAMLSDDSSCFVCLSVFVIFRLVVLNFSHVTQQSLSGTRKRHIFDNLCCFQIS